MSTIPEAENQQTVARWSEETFGPVSDHKTLVTRAMTEMEELLEAIEKGDISEAGKEAADVTILLWRLMELNGLNLDNEVTKKMAENRGRQWTCKGDGTGKHIA